MFSRYRDFLTVRNFFYLSFILLFLSIAYYFAIYIPKRDKTKIKLQLLLEKNKQNKIDECLDQASEAYFQSWNSNCASLGKEEQCSLPSENGDDWNKMYTTLRNECYKRYYP